jgi:hypothetical protein
LEIWGDFFLGYFRGLFKKQFPPFSGGQILLFPTKHEHFVKLKISKQVTFICECCWLSFSNDFHHSKLVTMKPTEKLEKNCLLRGLCMLVYMVWLVAAITRTRRSHKSEWN